MLPGSYSAYTQTASLDDPIAHALHGNSASIQPDIMDCRCFEIRAGRAFVQFQIRTLKTAHIDAVGFQNLIPYATHSNLNLIRPRINVVCSFRQGAVQASFGVRCDKLTAVLLREYISK
jgi:hypothetical protein